MEIWTLSIAGHALSELFLAIKMSMVNIENMTQMRAAAKQGRDPVEAGAVFLKSIYYRAWSRAQLNNTEYAPMLALLIMGIHYKRRQRRKELSTFDKIPMVGSVLFSYLFLYSVIADSWNPPKKVGIHPWRPPSALGRYIMMGWLIQRLLA